MPKRKRSKKATWANPELAAAMRELRRSSAAQRHTVITRKGSRANRQKRAIEDHKQGGEE